MDCFTDDHERRRQMGAGERPFGVSFGCPSQSSVVADDESQTNRAGEAIGLGQTAPRRADDEGERQPRPRQRLDVLGIMATEIAHDLNNTLVPVVALSKELLRKMPADDVDREALELICHGGEQASLLVRRILNFACDGASTAGFVDLSRLAGRAVRLLQWIAPGIVFKTTLPAVPPIWGDEGELHQVMLNLLTNAVQAIAGNAGEIAVEVGMVRADPLDDKAALVTLVVRDTGCGMDEATLGRAFEPFFTTKPAGTGIGLSIVSRIIKGHQGTVTIDSHPGIGTRFEIRLPIRHTEAGVPK